MKAIIFDFDGTIADSFPYVSDFLALKAGLAPLDDAGRQKLRGLSMQAMAVSLGFGWWRMPSLFFKGRRQMRVSGKSLKPFDGVPELIAQLRKDGHDLYLLSSNSSRNIMSFLRAYDLDSYFIEVYGSVGLFNKAPALRRLLRKHGIALTDAVYIGDEMRDSAAAHSIKLRIISVSWGFARRSDLVNLKPLAVADTTAELAAIIAKKV